MNIANDPEVEAPPHWIDAQSNVMKTLMDKWYEERLQDPDLDVPLSAPLPQRDNELDMLAEKLDLFRQFIHKQTNMLALAERSLERSRSSIRRAQSYSSFFTADTSETLSQDIAKQGLESYLALMEAELTDFAVQLLGNADRSGRLDDSEATDELATEALANRMVSALQMDEPESEQ